MRENTAQMPVVEPLPLDLTGLKWWQKLTIWLTYRRQWRLVQDYEFWCPIIDDWCRIPAGFIFDFASVPKLLYSILNPTGLLLAGSVPHDFIYRHGGLWTCSNPGEDCFVRITRKRADRIFLAIGEMIGAGWAYKSAWLMLRLFGGRSYLPPTVARHQKNSIG